METLRKGLYAGSFDPPTNGHKWIIEAGSKLFDELHVAVAVNPAKQGTFSRKDRISMLRDIAFEIPNVEVSSFENRYTVHHARDLDCKFLLRGLRNAQDFDAEQQMSIMNREIAPEIQTVLLPGPVELLTVSSSAIKGMVGPENWEEEVCKYVPRFVYDSLRRWHEEDRMAA